MKNPLLFIYTTNILVRLLTVNMKNFSTPKIRKCETPFQYPDWKCDPIIVKPVVIENAAPSSGTSPLPPFKEFPPLSPRDKHHHHQSLFIHEIVSFYMVFLGIVFKTRLKYSKELLTIMLKIQKLTLWIIRVTMGHGVLEKSFPWIEVLKTFKLGSFLISEGILFHRTDPL